MKAVDQIQSSLHPIVVIEPDPEACVTVCAALHALELPFRVTSLGHVHLEKPAPESSLLLILGLPHTLPQDSQPQIGLLSYFPQALVLGLCPSLESAGRTQWVNAGIDFLLQKPFTLAECTASIQALLRRARGQ